MRSAAEKLLKRYRKLKTLPHIAIHLTGLIANPDSTMQDFEEVIRLDPTLVIRLLRLVNSPLYSLRQKVTSISEAVVFIGLKNLRNMVITAALKDIFSESPHEEIFSRKKLWLHCSAAAICSQMISERIFSKSGEDAFLTGILHDIGLIVEDQVAHDQFIRICRDYRPGDRPLTRYEDDVLRTNHCELGFLVAEQWKVPRKVQEGIGNHHNLKTEITPSSLSGIVQFAEYIVTRMNYPAIPSMHPALSPTLAGYIKENYSEFKAMLQDLPKEIARASELYEFQGE